MITKAPRGTKDVIPQESYKWHYVEEKIRNICKNYGYKEVRVPVFEHTELFERGVGDTTDVVQKEMYTFEDKGGRSITLRPEGTAGTVRCFLENNLYAESQPTKMYYMLSCYRYEKPQAGRLREFHQFGIEAFGSPDSSVDAEVISMAFNLLTSLGVKNLKLYVNSIGCPECRREYNAKLKDYFSKYTDELCETCKTRLEKNPMRIIDCKVPHCEEIGAAAPKILNEQCPECTAHYDKLCRYLDTMGIEYEIDDTIVRGLDYYTTTVFEIKSEGLVVCGGGRYNGLVEELGGKPTPGVGFGMGLERLLMVLEAQNLLPESNSDVQLYISHIGDEADIYAQKLVNELRIQGVAAEKDLMSRSLKAQMKYADKIGAKYTVVIGDDEIKNGTVNVKNMTSGEQKEINISDLKKVVTEGFSKYNMNNRTWIYKNIDNVIMKNLMIRYGFSELCAGVLHNRLNIVGGNPDNLFKRVLHNLHNPFLLNDMDLAVERIEKAIMRNEKITVFGDYDADGVTSTAILYMFLKENGANADFYIPNRFTDGYGMNVESVKRISKSGTKLIITVDNGISAFEEIEYAKSLGVDVIVTDHHQCPDKLPECCAVINPKRKDSTYPFSELAGVGVAFKLITALNKEGLEKIIKKYILITAIGTIADVVPLNDENRAIAIMGLKMTMCNSNCGAQALMEVTGIQGEAKISDFSFGIVPRINAAGRLEDASVCVELLSSTDYIKCFETAKKLDELNTKRQSIEQSITEEAFKIIEENKLYKDNVIVVYGDNWNHGVIGIVASKVCEKYYKPCLVLTNDSDNVVKGSGRSVSDFNLYDALSYCAESLLKFGGHSLAAGLSLDNDKIDDFRNRINDYAHKKIGNDGFVQKIYIDYTLDSSFLNVDTIKSIDALEPYGIGNPKPVFALLDAVVVKKQLLSDGKHIKLTLKCDETLIDAVGFYMGDYSHIISEGNCIDVAGNLDVNNFRGVETPQIIIKDIRRIRQK